jgi:CRISPR/Cas system CSM-associated protein Csm3 (group 7 of RAMP superfamily)
MSKNYVAISFRLRFPGPVSVADVSAATIEARARQVKDRDQRAPDILVAQDHEGRPVLRGTSVMGSLRAHLDTYLVQGRQITERTINSVGKKEQSSRAATLADVVAGAAPEETERVAGAAPEKRERVERVTRPSAVRVLACDVNSGGAEDGPTRVAISRSRGAAEVNKLFQRQELAGGATATVVLRFDPSAVPAGCQDPTQALLAALQQWSPQLGGLTSTGYGHAEVEDLKWGQVDLGSDAGLAALFGATDTLALYRDAARKPVREVLPEGITATDAGGWDLDVVFQLQDSLLISPAIEPDGREVAVTRRRGNQYVVPGSAWKGVIRSRAEYILRSAGVYACESTTSLCCQCPTCVLFGCTPDAGSQLKGHRSLLEFPDSLFNASLQTRVHNAVDRFTGGAADKKLFTQKVAVAPADIPLKVTAFGALPDWAEPLLMMVLRDFHDGLIGIGARSNRGAGTLRLETEPDVSGWPQALASLRKEFKESA